ncbi:MAG: LysR family transcriptional regulator [Stappiaceae bacterium]
MRVPFLFFVFYYAGISSWQMGEAMNWDDLKIFLALAREQSVRGAGALLKVSHSTVARRIEEFENSLGVRLFDRTPGGYVLTKAGEDIRTSAERMEEEAEALQRLVLGKDKALAGEIRLTLPDAIAVYLLMPDLARFTQQFPDVDLSVHMSYEVVDLSKREADVAIRFYGVGKSPPEHLIGRKIGSSHDAVYAHADYLERTDFYNQPGNAHWVGWGDPERFPKWVLISRYPETPTRGNFESVILQALAARNGMGIAVLPCFIGDCISELTRVCEPTPEPTFDIWLLSHPDLRDTARLRVFRDFIAEAFRRHSAAFSGHKALAEDMLATV